MPILESERDIQMKKSLISIFPIFQLLCSYGLFVLVLSKIITFLFQVLELRTSQRVSCKFWKVFFVIVNFSSYYSFKNLNLQLVPVVMSKRKLRGTLMFVRIWYLVRSSGLNLFFICFHEGPQEYGALHTIWDPQLNLRPPAEFETHSWIWDPSWICEHQLNLRPPAEFLP